MRLFEVLELQMLNLAGENTPVAIYGAAGKGIVFGFTLQQLGIKNIIAVDGDLERQGKFMEVSGIQIMSYRNFL